MKTQGIQNPVGERMQKRLYNVSEAARYIGRSPWAVREMYYAGKLPCVRDGKRMLFDIDDLNLWIKRSKLIVYKGREIPVHQKGA